jgi:GNAT superfamily N-acetyltransferase
MIGLRTSIAGWPSVDALMKDFDGARTYLAGMKSSRAILKIRPARRGDAAEIMRVRREAILAKAGSHYDQVIVQEWAGAMDAPDRAARIGKQISDPNYLVLVAEAGGQIIGFAMANLSKNELQALYVKPNPIGKVGRALLAALEKLAFETAPHLVCDASLNAEQFYRANGYTEECRKDYVPSHGGVISRVVQMKKVRPGAKVS